MKLFVFGSTGDLVRRKVLPALQSLNQNNLEVWAVGRRTFTEKVYKDFACTNKCSLFFKKRIHYIQVDFKKQDVCVSCMNLLDKNELTYFYIAMPPEFYKKIILSLTKLKKKGFKLRVLIEKPFGKNLKNAKELKDIIEKKGLKNDVFLSDHYLFKENIINLKKTDSKKLKLISIEKVGLEKRIRYYNAVGALKDMIQSHFFSIVFRLLKNPRELESLKVIKYVRAQYGNGINQGYVKELGRKSKTETFVYLNFKTNKREFIFITGKALNKKKTKIILNKKSFLTKSSTSYKLLFSKFFLEKKQFFPTIKDSIFSWKLIEKINLKKPSLKYYKKGLSLSKLLNKLNIEKSLTSKLGLVRISQALQNINKTKGFVI